MNKKSASACAAVLVIAALCLVPPAAAQIIGGPAPGVVSTPAQLAYLNAEIKKAQARFAQQAALISGVSAARILNSMPPPTDWRAGDPKFAVIPALERERNAKLSDEQRLQIILADRDMKLAIEKARAETKAR